MIVPEKTNPWLLEKLREKRLLGSNPRQMLGLVVEVERDYTEEVASELQAMEIEVKRGLISWGRFIPVVAPAEKIPDIQRIPRVRKVHYEMPRYPYVRKVDPLLGEIRLSEVEIPYDPVQTFLGALPSLPFWGPLGLLAGPARPGIEMWPTGTTRGIIGAPEINRVEVKCAVLDTGPPIPLHPLLLRIIEVHSTTGEPPVDGQGHGTHVLTTAFAGHLDTRFGRCKSVADARRLLAVKCLTDAGFGTTSTVLKAMEYAYYWGAKVVNMSLGGPLQGGVEWDLECRVIQETGDEVAWCCAAGNEGPDMWTIGSPAAAPKALAVGSYSPRYKGVAVFSSRGPNASWYATHRDAWERDLARYGEDLIKPDVLCPGGGPAERGQEPVDVVYAGVQGWSDGMSDMTVDGFEGMRGTSVAAPHCAGLVAILYDEGKVRTAADVKSAMRGAWEKPKDIAWGYGLMRYDRFGEKTRPKGEKGKTKMKLKVV